MTALFAAAGVYFAFAYNPGMRRIWILIELLQVVALVTLGIIRLAWVPATGLARGYVLHPVLDLHGTTLDQANKLRPSALCHCLYQF